VSAPVIETVELTKSYGKFRGIEGINIAVDAGEIYGFIGPNGAGKSTTIRSLLALVRPTSGTAMIFGKDCAKEAAVIAKDVGYLPGEPSCYENMRAKEFLDYAAALYGVRARSRTKELAERLSLDLSRKISDLSLGNKKKVGIVACLLHSPKLLILDEPTSGLDPLMQKEFFDILLEESRRGATIFFSSHVLSEVQKICGRVAILKEGKIISVQKISELRKNGCKRVRLSSLGGFREGCFDFPGVADLEQEGANASFMFMGEAGEILKRATGMELADIFIEEPTLEEIFMHYYAR
jgi:ABC-2 type transport system ATP-binding protein